MSKFPGPRDWGRVITACLTPFSADGSVNEPEFQRVVQHLLVDQANDGIVVCGTTGESPTLSHEEKLRLLVLALEVAGQDKAIIFGAGTYNTSESIELTLEAEKLGAHGIMLVNPYYSRPGQAGLEAHFRAVSAETGLPVMLYNIQGRSAINLETETLRRLMDVPNIVAVKEASGSIAQISEVCAMAPDDFRIYSGDDGMTLPALAVGSHGVVSVAGHIVGKEIGEMVRSFATSPAQARQIHQSLLPTFKAIFRAPSPVPIKYALSRKGFDCASVRLPLVELNEQEKRDLELALKPLSFAAAMA